MSKQHLRFASALLIIVSASWRYRCGRQGRYSFSTWSPNTHTYTHSMPKAICHQGPQIFFQKCWLNSLSVPACLYHTHLAQALVSCHPACLLYTSNQVKYNMAQLSSIASFQFSTKALTMCILFDLAILLGGLFLRNDSKMCTKISSQESSFQYDLK